MIGGAIEFDVTKCSCPSPSWVELFLSRSPFEFEYCDYCKQLQRRYQEQAANDMYRQQICLARPYQKPIERPKVTT